ncbi:unnamed protein product, partial [Brachionus calyciflorus]
MQNLNNGQKLSSKSHSKSESLLCLNKKNISDKETKKIPMKRNLSKSFNNLIAGFRKTKSNQQNEIVKQVNSLTDIPSDNNNTNKKKEKFISRLKEKLSNKIKH